MLNGSNNNDRHFSSVDAGYLGLETAIVWAWLIKIADNRTTISIESFLFNDLPFINSIGIYQSFKKLEYHNYLEFQGNLNTFPWVVSFRGETQYDNLESNSNNKPTESIECNAWIPDQNTVRNLRQHGMNEKNVNSYASIFAKKYFTSNVSEIDPEEFIKFALAKHYNSSKGKKNISVIPTDWKPHESVIKQLADTGIPRWWIMQETPKFVLFWSESKTVRSSWVATFIVYVKVEWDRYINNYDETTNYRALPTDWIPSDITVKDIMKEGIAESTIQKCIPLFRIYAREFIGTARNWGYQFIRYVLTGEHQKMFNVETDQCQ